MNAIKTYFPILAIALVAGCSQSPNWLDIDETANRLAESYPTAEIRHSGRIRRILIDDSIVTISPNQIIVHSENDLAEITANVIAAAGVPCCHLVAFDDRVIIRAEK